MKNSKVLWFTGLSGSGKTTITDSLKKEFDSRGKSYQVFDGDDVRERLHKHLGFTPEDIKENNRLIVELCRGVYHQVDYIIVPVISPFRESRDKAREVFGKDFVEIYINCSYEECKRRDVKGLYAKAERGEISNFIGLQIPYEPPINPEIEIYSTKESVEKSLEKIISFLGL